MRKYIFTFFSSLIFIFIILNFFEVYNFSLIAIANRLYSSWNSKGAEYLYNKVKWWYLKNTQNTNYNIYLYNKWVLDFYSKFIWAQDIFVMLENPNLESTILKKIESWFIWISDAYSKISIEDKENKINKYSSLISWLRNEIQWMSLFFDTIKAWSYQANCERVKDNMKSALENYYSYVISNAFDDAVRVDSHIEVLKIRLQEIDRICLANKNSQNDKMKNDDKTSESKDEWDKSESKKQEIKDRKWTNNWQFNNMQNPSSDWSEKYESDKQKEEVEWYAKFLKDFQNNNQDKLDRNPKKSDPNEYQSLLDRFAQDPFFKDVLPDSSWKKDW